MLPRLRLPARIPGVRTTVLLPLSLLFAAAALSAAVLGLIGILQVEERRDLDLDGWDVAHGVVQLFTGQTPTALADDDTDVPLAYDIAKAIAPMSTAYAFVATATVLLSERWRLLRARRARDHVIVCGGGRTGVFLSRALAADGPTVLVDHAAATEQVTTSLVRGIIPLSGDARDDVVLQRASLPRARAVFAIADAADVNAAVATTARTLVLARATPLDCYALIDDPELQIALQARFLGTEDTSAFRLHLLERDQVFASAVVRDDPPDPRTATVVAGTGPLAVALAVEAAKALSSARRRGAPRPVLLAAGPRPDELLTALAGRLPHVADDVELQAVPRAGAAAGAAALDGGLASATAYVAGVTDAETLKAGLLWMQPGDRSVAKVVLCVDAETGIAGTLSTGLRRRRDDTGGLVRVHSRTLALADPDHLREQVLTEKLARGLHAQFLRHAAETDPARSDAAVQPWGRLPETLRASNRAQAEHVAEKLALLPCVVVPAGPDLPTFAFTDDEVERLAEAEHLRWVEERVAAGLTFGLERTERTHPDLVPWQDLSDAEQEKDRMFVRALPRVLAREGLALARIRPRLPSAQGLRV